MKRRFPLILAIFGLAGMIACYYAWEPESGQLPPPGPQVGAGSADGDSTNPEGKRSAARVIGGVTEKAHDTPTETGKADVFVKKVLAEKWTDAEGKAGRRRVRIVEADFKYPRIRLEEEVWTDPETGTQTVNRLLASVADHVMVGLKPGADEQAAARLLEQNGYRVRAVEPGSYILAELPGFEAIDAQEKSIANIEGLNEFIDYAEPDYLVYPCVVPNDPAFSGRKMWGLDNPGLMAGTKADADIDAPEAWAIRTDASNVIVAVTDTGIQYNHEDLAPNMWSNGAGEHGWDAYDNDNDPMDTGGHGTHCAGTIGARGNNNIGLTGVAWNVQLMAGRFLGPEGGTTSDGITVINYARDNGAHIISASWGGGGFSNALYNAIKRAGDAGIPFIAAAGNDALNNDSTPHYPSSYDLPNLVAVASTTSKDTLSYFSCYGRYSVDIGAPGSDIWSCYIGSNSSYKHLNGTSMATPHVSGAMALARAEFPGDSAEELIARLYSSVDHTAALAGKVSTGGRLNLHKLLGASSAEVSNDDFDNALRFEGDYGYWSGSNKTATREDGESDFNPVLTGSRSLWFAWKAPYTGLVEFEVTASETPFRIIAFEGDNKNNLRIAKDGNTSPKKTETIYFYCQQDQEYRFLIDSSHPVGQSLVATLELKPANDDFADAIILSGERFSTRGSNRNATDQPFERYNPHAGVGKGKTVWWKWTPDFDGEFVITTQGSEFDTVLAVYLGKPGVNLTEVASNDDRNALDWTSQVTFNASHGATYYIAVDGYRGDAAGGILLNGGKRGDLLILKQPEDKLATLGDAVDFNVVAMSYNKLRYTWYRENQILAGVNGDTLHINSITAADFAKYHVVISDGESSVSSSDAELNELRLPPVIVWTPRSMSVASGETLQLKPQVNGSEPLSYQWYKDGVALPGEISKSMAVANVNSSHQGYYHLEVSNDLGSVESKLINVSVQNVPWSSLSYTFPYPQAYDVFDIEYADGSYVAVGDAGTIVSSPDAVSWKVHSLGDTNFRFKRVVNGNGIWLAVDWNGHLAWSDDLVIWNKKTESQLIGNGLFDVFFWKGKFYFMKQDGADSKIYTSINAENWVLSKVLTGNSYNDALMSPSTLVLFENGTNDVLTTTNGTTWTRTTVVPGSGEPALNKGLGLYKDGEFRVWAKKNKKGIWTSSNGIDWVFTDHGTQTYWPGLDQNYDYTMHHRFVYANGTYYWIDQGWKFFHASTDGTKWKRYTMGFEVNAVTDGPGAVVIAGDDGVTSKAAEVSGLYGDSLSSPINPDERFTQLKVVNGRAWAATSGGRYFSSSDGSSWRQDGTIRELGSLIFANGKYWCGQGLGIGGTAYKIFKGAHPTELEELQDCNLTRISLLAHNGNKFVAVSTASPRGLYCSTDGVNWTVSAYALDVGATIKVLDYIGGKFVALDGSGNIYSSSDGDNWDKYDTNVGYTSVPQKIAYCKGLYFALGGECGLWYSSDAVNWSFQDLGSYTTNGPASVSIMGDDNGVAVFLNNTGLYSSNPANHNAWYQFTLPSTHFGDAAYFMGSVISMGGYGSLSMLQGGTPTSYAPLGRFKNIRDGGRYLVNSQIKIETEASDPEGEAINTSFWIDGVKVAESAENNPEFQWYPTEAGKHSLHIDVVDATGVRNEHRITVEILASSLIGNHADLNNSTGVFHVGGELYLAGAYGKLASYRGADQYTDIAVPTDAEISSLAYGKGVNVIGGNEVLVSSDGFNWDLIPDISGRVGYDNGMFYAVGAQKLHFSFDGYQWETSSFSGISQTTSKVFYQDGKIVAGGNNNVIVSSNLGRSWKDLEINSRSIIRWQNKILATNPTSLYQTEDAQTWIESPLPTVGGYLGSILHEAGGMLFLGRPTTNSLGGFELLYASLDASDWNAVTGAGACHDIEYGNNTWVSFGSGSAFSSSDGVNWELILGYEGLQSPPAGTPLEFQSFGSRRWSVEYHKDYGFVALGETWFNLISATSPDGQEWAYAVGDKTSNSNWSQIATHDGYTCVYRAGKIEGSDDFENWSPVANQPSGNVVRMKILNGKFVCITHGGQVGFSEDGVHWVYHLIEPELWLRDIAFRDGKYVVVASPRLYVAVDRVYISSDQVTWTKADLPREYTRITTDDSQFILYGNGLRYALSADGSTWTETTLVSNEVGLFSLGTLTYGAGGYLCTYGNKGSFTADFATWVPVEFQNSGTVLDVNYSSIYGFSVLSSEAGIFSSQDGMAWGEPQRALSGALSLMDDGDDFYVASGYAVELKTNRDIEVASITVPSGDYGVGDTIQAEVVIKNHSNKPVDTDSLNLKFVSSKDFILGNGDDYLISFGHTLQQPVPAGGTVTETIEFVIPTEATAGSAYVAVYAVLPRDYIEVNKANNIRLTPNPALSIPEWELNLNTAGNGQINQDLSAIRYPHGSRVSLTANAGKGAAFSGWGGDALGAENQITILMDGDKSVQAKFSSQTSLQVHVRGAGQVDGLADLGSYAVNDTASLTAVPADGWEFSGWSGAATGNTAFASILMGTNKVVTATFIKTKLQWRTDHFPDDLDDPEISGDDADPDGDGLKNWQEYLHLSNPRDAASKGVQSMKVEGGYLYAIFTRNGGAESGLSLACQGSRDLSDWDGTDVRERVLNTKNGVETVEARIPVSGGEKGFLRLKYNRPAAGP